MTSPTHDATALTAAFVLWPPHGDMTGLLLAVGLIATMGAMEAVATARFRPRERAWRAECNRLRMQGVEHPEEEALQRPRWQGPRRSLTRPMRLLALIGTAMVSMPLAVALGCARLPDQLEVGPIDHRRLTHFAITAAALIFGAHVLATYIVTSPDVTWAQGELLWQAFTVGYLTHLAMDACTRSGVPLLWPLVREDIRLVPRSVMVPWPVVRIVAMTSVVTWERKRLRVAPRTGGPVDTLVMALSLGVIVWAVQG